MKASELGLVGVTAKVAADFELAFPDAVFTSGRRSIISQAHAMATNVAIERLWIRGGTGVRATYVQSDCADACHGAVLSHPDARTVDELTALLFGVMQGYSDDELARMTVHPSGHAFDVQPDGDAEKLLWLAMRAEKEKGKLIEKEGGLDRWHWQAP